MSPRPGLPKSQVRVIPFIELQTRFSEVSDAAEASGGTAALPTPWKTASGLPITEKNASIQAFVCGTRFAFYYMNPERTRYTVMVGDMATMAAHPLAREDQFYTADDCLALCKEYLTLSITFEDVTDALDKGRGSNVDAIRRNISNKARSSALNTYRTKMRTRQYPLKVAARYDWLIDMIERKQITAAQLTVAARMAEDLEAIAEGKDAPHNMNSEKAKRDFIAGDSGAEAD